MSVSQIDTVMKDLSSLALTCREMGTLITKIALPELDKRVHQDNWQISCRSPCVGVMMAMSTGDLNEHFCWDDVIQDPKRCR